MNDDELRLPRRKVLAGLGTIGVASAGAGMGTMAYLSDEEEIKENMLTAGELDLKLDWYWFYKGRERVTDTQPLANDDHLGPMIELDDVKPGDWGCGVISIHVYDNPAYVWFRTSNVHNVENGQNEPERETEGVDTDGKGELAENIHWVAAPLGCYDTNDSDADPTAEDVAMTDGPVVLDDWTTDQSTADNSDKKYCYYKGTLDQVLSHPPINLGPKPQSNTCYIGFCWKVPKDVGNEIQSDRLKFDLDFYAEQKRHNTNPTNPWANSA